MDEIDKYNDIPQLVKDFLDYSQTIQGKSELTILEYYYDLRVFLKYMKTLKIEDMKDVKLNHLYNFAGYLANKRKLCNSSRGRKIATIKAYFKYLHKKAKYLLEDPTAELEKPKPDKLLPKYLNIDESRGLLESVNGKYEIRDYAIITLFLNCGLRLSELVSINISSIRDDKLVVMGKGKKERTIYLNDACLRVINEYLKVRPTLKAKDKDALFLSERYTRISNKMVQYLVKKNITNAGLDRTKYSTHKLRHTAATLMYKHGGIDILALKDILGHENVNTTQIYTHVDNEQLKNAINKNPLSDVIKS